MAKFVKGQSGNPAGRPAGTRNKLVELFVSDLQEKWRTDGADILDRLAKDDPAKLVEAISRMAPKDVAVTLEQRGPLDSEEMRYMRRLVDVLRAAGATGIDPELMFAWIEDDLRARLAKHVPEAGQLTEIAG
ncbi:DUF5681 domain-containing protein [Bradyrhizobium sp. 13971]